MDQSKETARLTNERFKDKFKSQFELVNYAIKLVDNLIKTGREPRVKTDVKNPALLVLAEIAANKDHFEDIEEVFTAEDMVKAAAEENKEAWASPKGSSRGHERKKNRLAE